MSPQVAHRYIVEILREGAGPLALPLHPDWIPPIECARFERIRNNAAAASVLPGLAYISPGWDRTAGAPYISHVDVGFDPAGKASVTIPLHYFATAVRDAVGTLVEVGRIDAGDRYRWKICAYRAAPEENVGAVREPFAVEL